MSFDFVAIDFETANNFYSSACSIGLVAVKDAKIMETFYTLIKPVPYVFDEANINIHGITAEDVKNAPTFEEVWEQIKDYFDGNIIVAHNAVFDMTVLKSSLIESNIDLPHFYYLCSIPISTIACDGEFVGQSLKDRTKYFNIVLENHHNAISDAEACAKLVISCLAKMEKRSLLSYCATYRDLSVKHFMDVKHQNEFRKTSNKKNFFSHTKAAISEIVASTDAFDCSHPLFGKSIVFTGDLTSMDRKTAMQKSVDLGAILKSSVSSKTDYLVVGAQDISLVGDDGMSTKEERAYELIKKGHAIKILNESDFLNLLSSR